MKLRSKFRGVLLLIVVMATFVSCSKDESKSTVDEVTDTVKEGTWKVSYFFDSGKDETVNYTGYEFVFGGNTVVTAFKGLNSYSGQWFVTKSTSDDDLFSTIFKIYVGPNDIFGDLNGDWKVVENTGSTLKLKDDSHGDTATDYLTFEKIVQ